MAQEKYGKLINPPVDDEEEHHENNIYDGYLSSLCEEEEEEEEEDSCDSLGANSSEDEDFMEDVNSSSCSLNSSLSSNSSNSSLFDMSSLISHLPSKKGLSKHYEGRSQSFTSLSSVRSLEDLIKPEKPLNRKIKPSKSYSWGTMKSSKIIKKKSSKGTLSSSLRNLKRHGNFFRSKPRPFPTQRFATGGLESVS